MPLTDLTVLVVEDHYFVATELTSVLRQFGANVVGPMARLPSDGSLAIDEIDAALVNLGSDFETSLPLIDELRNHGVPVALVTGYGPFAIPLRYRDLPRLDKPMAREKLLPAVLLLARGTQGLAA
jgi:DNA-binding response OmpR family regulator